MTTERTQVMAVTTHNYTPTDRYQTIAVTTLIKEEKTSRQQDVLGSAHLNTTPAKLLPITRLQTSTTTLTLLLQI